MAERLANMAKEYSMKGGVPREQQWAALQELTKPHIDSFNYLLHEGLNKIVQHMLPVQFEISGGKRYSIFIQDMTILSPRLPESNKVAITNKVYPAECRERCTTYKGDVMIRVAWKSDGKLEGFVEKNAGQIPIMVKSDACHLAKLSPKDLIRHGEEAEEMGGYFIVNGQEKVVRMLILPRRNYPLCIKRPSWKTRGQDYTEYGLTMRCVRPDQSAINMTLHYLQSGSVKVCIAYNKQLYYIPLIMVLKALLDVSDKYIYDQLIGGKEDDSFFKGCATYMLYDMLEQNLLTRTQMLQYLGERFRVRLNMPSWYTHEQVGEFLISQCICVHLESNLDKFNKMVYMTKKLLSFAKGECAEESADNPMNQELLLSGHLLLMLLKEKAEGWLYGIKMGLDKVIKNKPQTVLNAAAFTDPCKYTASLTRPLEYLLATGNLNSRSALGLMQAAGLSVIADKLNFYRFLSHFRCVHRGAFFAQMRTTAVRKLLPEAWGFLCPVHTPDGTPCGLLNHMSADCQAVNTPCATDPIVEQLQTLGMCPTGLPLPIVMSHCYPVLLDGRLVGYFPDDIAVDATNQLRALKVLGLHQIPSVLEICLVPKTEVASQYPGLYLFSTLARMVRPVLNLQLNKTEMLGTFEQVYLDIAVCAEEIHPGVTTHMEPSEQSMLSVIATLTPFSDFNQSPRNMYQCQMGKQTMGTPLHAYQHRADNKLYRILTPQTPLVRPQAHEKYNIDEYPMGTNAVVAVISATGYDMEDAMTINKASYERGFAHGCIYKSSVVDLTLLHKDKATSESLVFGCETATAGLDPDGLPPVGQLLKDGNPMYSYINLQTNTTRVERYRGAEEAYVDHIKILGTESGQGKLNKVCLVLRVVRNPTIGDKFSSRHGQKGVCSMLWPAENMPFTASGMVPDICFNPHGYPSRMTIGMMIESMAGKSGALHGLFHDATPFTFSEDQPAAAYFGELLHAAGYNELGTETMYCGETGTELEARIFMGVVYYQRLRHMVSDKFQVRTTGPVDPLTQQPVKGRKRMGGVRFGEMERDALISHGTSFLLHDRLFNCSDKCSSYLCKGCGSLLSTACDKPSANIAAASFEAKRRWTCLTCGKSDKVTLVSVPYVLKYLLVELAVMGIKFKLDAK
ncbi:DNA-directed RNA polymerase I subunit RPA2-like [Littorina saxatilis]|uniref:DNA-directed RNA polymerase subunit beta n=1 Tax=Littorina saxatilis TaxID=31220 RepID=A0AAN9BSX7_9CAEN